jgi:hypothetical protein
VRIIASLRTDWDDAAPLLKEAIDALRELNRAADPSDTYAIVTLAEGHISVILRFFGVALARLCAFLILILRGDPEN